MSQKTRRLSRREFLIGSAASVVGVVLTAAQCGAPSPTPAPAATEAPAATPTPAAPEATPTPVAIKVEEATPTPVPTAAAAKYKEAPMLAELVKAGKLPPLEERLPKDVQTIAVVDKIGKYGGTWRTVTDNPGLWTIRMKTYEPPVRWKPDYTGYEAGFAKDWEWSDDGKTITFEGTVTGFILEYIPRSYTALSADFLRSS
jgi:peptide/nickel transport system substrate-binding protein